MNFLSNAFNQPRTSVAGLLIAAVSVFGSLSQQGITFGKVGTGTVAGLVAGIASALLGALAKDPDTDAASTTKQ